MIENDLSKMSIFDKKQAAILQNTPPYDIISEPTVSVYSTIGSEEQQRIADFVKLSGFIEKYIGFDWFLRIESLKNSLQRLLPIRRFIGGGSKTVGSGFKALCPCQKWEFTRNLVNSHFFVALKVRVFIYSISQKRF